MVVEIYTHCCCSHTVIIVPNQNNYVNTANLPITV